MGVLDFWKPPMGIEYGTGLVIESLAEIREETFGEAYRQGVHDDIVDLCERESYFFLYACAGLALEFELRRSRMRSMVRGQVAGYFRRFVANLEPEHRESAEAEFADRWRTCHQVATGCKPRRAAIGVALGFHFAICCGQPTPVDLEEFQVVWMPLASAGSAFALVAGQSAQLLRRRNRIVPRRTYHLQLRGDS